MPNDEIEIKFILDNKRMTTLKHAFPGKGDYQEVATNISRMITNELIDLLAGQKRYLSLSHQYIEWIQSVYELLLPDEEYTYQTIYDRFNFPPGTAGYIARVLRSRQNTSLHQRAIESLKAKLNDEINDFNALPQDEFKSAQKMRNIKLTLREYDILQMAIDNIFRKQEAVDLPTVITRTKEFIDINFSIENIQKVIPELNNLVMEG